MNADMKALYSSIIKAHNEAPFQFEKIRNPSNTVKAYNPICGDRFEIYVTSNQGKISGLHFHGFGCAISKASTSILTKALQGKTHTEARLICDRFLSFLDNKSEDKDLDLPDDFKAFSGVHDFPERYDCAGLPWKEMKKFLQTVQK